jgi:MOSC domain-containing protein YiiM
MKSVGKVLFLYISQKDVENPINRDNIYIDENGIIEDKHYGTNLERSILITSLASYDILIKEKIKTKYGILGENLLIDYNPYLLDIGTKLQIGNTILQISQNCTLCNHLSKIDNRIPKLLKKDRGIFGKVIQEGFIKTGDEIFLLDS